MSFDKIDWTGQSVTSVIVDISIVFPIKLIFRDKFFVPNKGLFKTVFLRASLAHATLMPHLSEATVCIALLVAVLNNTDI